MRIPADGELIREPNRHLQVVGRRPKDLLEPSPIGPASKPFDWAQEPDRVRSDDVITVELPRWQHKALLGVLAHTDTPEARSLLALLSPHPSLMGPRS